MNHKFQAAVHQRDGFAYVKLGGVIDEDNELTDLSERIPAGTVVIDLGEIERINSCGVRDWVNWLTRIEKQGAKVVLVECSPAIVAQINLVNNFTGNGMVKSFYAPYFCPNCDREKVLLVEASELGPMSSSPQPYRAPICRCDECDGVMDFDDMEDSYFAFLSSTKKVADAAKISVAVAEISGNGGEEKSKIRSRVGTGSSGGGSGGGLGANVSSLPSVPALPSISRAASVSGLHAAAAGPSLGAAAGGNGRFTTGGGSSANRFTPANPNNRFGTGATTTGSGAGSRPGTSGGGGTDPAGRAAALAMEQGRFTGPITQPKSGKMIYVLVVVLIAALVVLAALLISGGGKDAGSNARPSSRLERFDRLVPNAAQTPGAAGVVRG